MDVPTLAAAALSAFGNPSSPEDPALGAPSCVDSNQVNCARCLALTRSNQSAHYQLPCGCITCQVCLTEHSFQYPQSDNFVCPACLAGACFATPPLMQQLVQQVVADPQILVVVQSTPSIWDHEMIAKTEEAHFFLRRLGWYLRQTAGKVPACVDDATMRQDSPFFEGIYQRFANPNLWGLLSPVSVPAGIKPFLMATPLTLEANLHTSVDVVVVAKYRQAFANNDDFQNALSNGDLVEQVRIVQRNPEAQNATVGGYMVASALVALLALRHQGRFGTGQPAQGGSI